MSKHRADMEDPMPRKVRNRRLSDEDEDMSMGWRVMYSMGMPLLYICAFLLGIVAVICNGIVTQYWADLSPPMCFIYSQTASQSLFYKFGGSLSSCQWITYGGVTGIIFLVLSAIIYFAWVRGSGKLSVALFVLEISSLFGTLMMMAVTCTLTEGLRQTCASMGINPLNMRGESCHSLLNLRVANYNLSVSSSTLIRGAMFTFWPCTVLMCIITIIHLCSCYRRCYR